jgi:hypothetical protein
LEASLEKSILPMPEGIETLQEMLLFVGENHKKE